MAVSSKDQLKLFTALLRVRHAELQLAERYKDQEMRTPTHFGVGQEAVAVGVCEHLRPSDAAYSHHRCHNHFLAKGGAVYRLAAELFGRKTGCSGGKGGSVHLTDRSCGFIASSAILGEAMAAATGSALHFKRAGTHHIATAFFGDAVAEEGAFYECLGYAGLNKLPVLYVCENNGYATESPMNIRQPEGASIGARVKSFSIEYACVDGNDVQAVAAAAKQAVTHIRTHSEPFFLECETYRWLEHVGPHFDHVLERTYRTKDELDGWMAKCPVNRERARLLASGTFSAEDLDAAEQDIITSVAAEIARAYEDPWPDTSALFENIQ